MSAASPLWTAHVHADRRARLLRRNQLVGGIRGHFEAREFIEVETSILQASPGNEAHLAAFQTTLRTPAGGEHAVYLHTSPEFACKKLLAAGERRIFTFARVFRNAERSALHHPEFTMLEWYRVGEPYAALMEDCADLLHRAVTVSGETHWRFRGREADPLAPPERLSVVEAFQRHAAIDLAATLRGSQGDRDSLAALASRAGVQVAADDTWSDIFSRVLVERIEPHLGVGRPTILDRYPIPEAALARPCPDDPRFAERFELYVCGVELANGFGELTNAGEQRRRFSDAMDLRAARYGERFPLDEDFLAALATMPEASGIALGFDRLAMLATGAERVEQVMWTPVIDPDT